MKVLLKHQITVKRVKSKFYKLGRKAGKRCRYRLAKSINKKNQEMRMSKNPIHKIFKKNIFDRIFNE
jgi:hypothetical protein